MSHDSTCKLKSTAMERLAGYSSTNVWQSRVEIEHSVAYFARIAAFEALKRGASVKGGGHTRFVQVHY